MRSLADAAEHLSTLDVDRLRADGAWTVGQVLVHCAQSIEYSLSGFPQYKPWLFRAVIGRIVLRRFLRQGYMLHSADAAIPGAPAPEASSAQAGLQRLLDAIAAFQLHPGPLAPHFAYGAVERDKYDRIQALHVADHLTHLR